MFDAAPVRTLSYQAALLFCTNRREGEVTHSFTHSLTHAHSWRKCWAISIMHCDTRWTKHALWFPIWTRQYTYPGLQSTTWIFFLISGIKALGSCNFSFMVHRPNFLKWWTKYTLWFQIRTRQYTYPGLQSTTRIFF